MAHTPQQLHANTVLPPMPSPPLRQHHNNVNHSPPSPSRDHRQPNNHQPHDDGPSDASNPQPTDHEIETGATPLPTCPIFISATHNTETAKHLATQYQGCFQPSSILYNFNQLLYSVRTPHIDDVEYVETTTANKAWIIVHHSPTFTEKQQLDVILEITAHIQVLLNNINANKPPPTSPNQHVNPYYADNKCCTSLSAFNLALPTINSPDGVNNIACVGMPIKWGGYDNKLATYYRLPEILRAIATDTYIWDNLTPQEQTTIRYYIKNPVKLFGVAGIRHTTVDRNKSDGQGPTRRGNNNTTNHSPRTGRGRSTDSNLPRIPPKQTYLGLCTAATPEGDTLRDILSKSLTQLSTTSRGRHTPDPVPLRVRFLPQHPLEILIFPTSNKLERLQLYDEIFFFTTRTTESFGSTVCKVIDHVHKEDVLDFNGLNTTATTADNVICITPKYTGLDPTTGSIHLVLAYTLHYQVTSEKEIAASIDIKQVHSSSPPPPSPTPNDPYSPDSIHHRRLSFIGKHSAVFEKPGNTSLYLVTWSLNGDYIIFTPSWSLVKSVTDGVSCSFQCKIKTIAEGLSLLSRHHGIDFKSELNVEEYNFNVPLNSNSQSWDRVPIDAQFIQARGRVTLTTAVPPPTFRLSTSEEIVFRYAVTSWQARSAFLDSIINDQPSPNLTATINTLILLRDRHVNFARAPRDRRYLDNSEAAQVLMALHDSRAYHNRDFTWSVHSPYHFLCPNTGVQVLNEHAQDILRSYSNIPTVGSPIQQNPPQPAQPSPPTTPQQLPTLTHANKPSPPATKPSHHPDQFQPHHLPNGATDSDHLSLGKMSIASDDDNYEMSASQDEMFCNATAPTTETHQPKRKSTHDSSTPPNSPKRQLTAATTTTTTTLTNNEPDFFENVHQPITALETLYWQHNTTPRKRHQDLLDFFEELTKIKTDIQTAAGNESLLVPCSPLTTYHDAASFINTLTWRSHADPSIEIKNFSDDIIHTALIQLQGPGSNLIPIGPPPPTHVVFVCRNHRTYENLSRCLRTRTILNFDSDETPRPFRHHTQPHQLLPKYDEWEAFCQQEDVIHMKLNCPNECHTPLFDRLYREFNMLYLPHHNSVDLDGIKEWFNTIARAGKPDQPSLV